MLKRINDALPGLVFGIVFYGIVVQLIGVWFVFYVFAFKSFTSFLSVALRLS